MNMRTLGASILGVSALLLPNACMAETGDSAMGAPFFGGTARFFLLVAYLFCVNIATIWVARDAKARAMGGSLFWMLPVFFLGPVGLALYLRLRPKGSVSFCSGCTQERLRAKSGCPHCGLAA
jgi:hypothetical protein